MDPYIGGGLHPRISSGPTPYPGSSNNGQGSPSGYSTEESDANGRLGMDANNMESVNGNNAMVIHYANGGE